MIAWLLTSCRETALPPAQLEQRVVGCWRLIAAPGMASDPVAYSTFRTFELASSSYTAARPDIHRATIGRPLGEGEGTFWQVAGEPAEVYLAVLWIEGGWSLHLRPTSDHVDTLEGPASYANPAMAIADSVASLGTVRAIRRACPSSKASSPPAP